MFLHLIWLVYVQKTIFSGNNESLYQLELNERMDTCTSNIVEEISTEDVDNAIKNDEIYLKSILEKIFRQFSSYFKKLIKVDGYLTAYEINLDCLFFNEMNYFLKFEVENIDLGFVTVQNNEKNIKEFDCTKIFENNYYNIIDLLNAVATWIISLKNYQMHILSLDFSTIPVFNSLFTLLESELDVKFDFKKTIEDILRGLNPLLRIILPEFEAIRDLLIQSPILTSNNTNIQLEILYLCILIQKIETEYKELLEYQRNIMYSFNFHENSHDNTFKRFKISLRIAFIRLINLGGVSDAQIQEYSVLLLLDSIIKLKRKGKLFFSSYDGLYSFVSCRIRFFLYDTVSNSEYNLYMNHLKIFLQKYLNTFEVDTSRLKELENKLFKGINSILTISNLKKKLNQVEKKLLVSIDCVLNHKLPSIKENDDLDNYHIIETIFKGKFPIIKSSRENGDFYLHIKKHGLFRMSPIFYQRFENEIINILETYIYLLNSATGEKEIIAICKFLDYKFDILNELLKQGNFREI
ncbi:hypothetical protein CWI37_0096p0020 [Hamiltosporidium tvaerminnensis]|uniref:Uncharacterized protein n=1 Tax=Hamiltosporidium tvaerminnensis TaxID=1176355 RepID=A0A4Q9LB39_9MICR|nr:hypothetical protein LUQ84_001769 [Hamiltosporidium tvaerminnensis]TBU04716.1 hypothetical protein CWI37_0096p0020 [Hamiltosporidium tvaerminnensis]